MKRGYSKEPNEHALTIGIRQILNLNRVFHWKHWGGPMGQKGISDIIGCIHGRMFCLEIKTTRGRVTPAQQQFLDDVNAAGGLALVVRSLNDVINGLGLRGMSTNM